VPKRSLVMARRYRLLRNSVSPAVQVRLPSSGAPVISFAAISTPASAFRLASTVMKWPAILLPASQAQSL
jgi:hypothetical protein